MKKGMILFVTQGKNELNDAPYPDMSGLKWELDVQSVWMNSY
jgi:hypothetical protein